MTKTTKSTVYTAGTCSNIRIGVKLPIILCLTKFYVVSVVTTTALDLIARIGGDYSDDPSNGPFFH